MGMAVLRRRENNRAFAVTAEHAKEFGAQALAAARAGMNPVTVIGKFDDIIAALLLDLPKACVPWRKQIPALVELPKLPLCPVSGKQIRNPHEPPVDARSVRVLEELHPRLSRWLKDCVKYGGPTAYMLDELKAEQLEASHERDLVLAYGDKEWEANLLRKDSGATLTEQGAWLKAIEDLTLVKIHRHEAELGSPSLGFDNLSVRSAIAKHDPALREIHKQAGEILNGWQAEAREAAAA
jgi:hypothetical protein